MTYGSRLGLIYLADWHLPYESSIGSRFSHIDFDDNCLTNKDWGEYGEVLSAIVARNNLFDGALGRYL